MDGQEFAFWLWRVSAIRIQIELSATVSSGLSIPSLSYDNTFNANGGIYTEEDQAISRRAFASNPPGIIMPIQESGSNFAFRFDWGGDASVNPDAPTNWAIPFEFNVDIFNGGSDANIDWASGGPGSGVNVAIAGEDAFLERSYSHENIAAFYNTSGNVTSFTGTVLITPHAYYEWQNKVGELAYDSTTGLPPVIP